MSVWKRRAFSLFGLVLASLGTTHVCVRCLTSQKPMLEVSPLKLRVESTGGKRVFAAIRLRNRGRGDLRIERVLTDCGCSLVDSFPHVLRSGESGLLNVEGYTAVAGSRTVHITIQSNCARRGRVAVELVLVDLTQPPIVVSAPPCLRMDSTRPSDTMTWLAVRTVEAAGTTPWLQPRVTPKMPVLLTVESIKERIHQGGPHLERTYIYRLDFAPDAAVGTWYGAVVLTPPESSNGRPSAVPIVAIRAPRLHLNPDTIYFVVGPTDGDRPTTVATVLDVVGTADDSPARIDSVECSMPGLKAMVDPTNGNRLVVTCDPSRLSARERICTGHLSVRVSSSGASAVVDVPVCVSFASGLKKASSARNNER